VDTLETFLKFSRAGRAFKAQAGQDDAPSVFKRPWAHVLTVYCVIN